MNQASSPRWPHDQIEPIGSRGVEQGAHRVRDLGTADVFDGNRV
jgi:hypothetical protein